MNKPIKKFSLKSTGSKVEGPRIYISGIILLFIIVFMVSCEDTQSEKQTEPVKTSAGALQLIIIGGPGAGKGTQAEKIKEKYGIAHISTGEMLRAEVAKGSELGKRVEAVMERGDLVVHPLRRRSPLERPGSGR